MGAGQSISEGSVPGRGLHVLRVTPGSPAFHAALEPFFDFIVGYESEVYGHSQQTLKDIETHDFEQFVERHEGKTLELIVWSSKAQTLRRIPITPSRAWSQHKVESDSSDNLKSGPSTPSQPSLLGLSMRVCEPEQALDNVWHVLDVLEGSPAESAGLVPYGDWIVGWSGGVLGAEGDFYELVESHEDKPLRVYVYSHDFDTLREVVLVPNRQWGGEGLLGCVFGFGLLHRIPTEPAYQNGIADPVDEVDEDGLDEATTFVPADDDEFQRFTPPIDNHNHYSHNTYATHLPQERTDATQQDRRAVLTSNPGRNHYLDPPFLPHRPSSRSSTSNQAIGDEEGSFQ